jgi:hypothetical protein
VGDALDEEEEWPRLTGRAIARTMYFARIISGRGPRLWRQRERPYADSNVRRQARRSAGVLERPVATAVADEAAEGGKRERQPSRGDRELSQHVPRDCGCGRAVHRVADRLQTVRDRQEAR